MLLLNRSSTPFVILSDPNPRIARFLPNTTRDLPTELAEKLLKAYKGKIITVKSLSADLVSGDEPKAKVKKKAVISEVEKAPELPLEISAPVSAPAIEIESEDSSEEEPTEENTAPDENK